MIKYKLPALKDENELNEYLQECFQNGEEIFKHERDSKMFKREKKTVDH